MESNFSKTAGDVVSGRHSREGGNPQLGDNTRYMDPRLRGGDAGAMYLPAVIENVLDFFSNQCKALTI